MLALFDEQEERVRAHALADPGEIYLTADLTALKHPCSFGYRTGPDQAVGQTELFVDLERAGLDTDRLRVGCRPLVAINDHEFDAVALQLARECESGRPRSYN